MTRAAVSIVIPVFNGERTLEPCVRAIFNDLEDRPAEILIVDDRSTDRSGEIAERFARDPRVRVLAGRARGAAAAINDGIRAARHAIVCQIDQDVIVHRGWFDGVTEPFADPAVGAVQGRYAASVGRGLLARAAHLDLADRYDRVRGETTDHVCTGNAAYRTAALLSVGLLDETLGYGYDNDLSYRLGRAGHRLVFRKDAMAAHAWRESLGGFLRQQFGVGYGRLEVIRRHPGRWNGDAVSGPGMIAHAALAAAACGLATIGLFLALVHGRWAPWIAAAGCIAGALAAERTVAGVRAWRAHGDRAALLFPVLHLVRDAVWVWAIVSWTWRAIARRPADPAHTMRRQDARPERRSTCPDPTPLARVTVILPACNEAEALPAVIGELRARWPDLHLLVVDDGSTDGTADVASRLGCETLRLPIRLGVGGAMHAGIRYARELGFAAAVRLDGDGQHSPEDLPAVLAPVLAGDADAVVGVRRWSAADRWAWRSVVRALLGVLLSIWTRRRVRDATSGFWAFGERAMRTLAVEHPTGYPEPELFLLLERRRMRVLQVPVTGRSRIAGATSLTPTRAGLALARALLALIVVPLRGAGDGPS